MTRLYCIEKCSVCRVELLIAATARARVVDHISRVAVKVRIARIDPAKICEQRDQAFLALVNAVTDTMEL